MGIENFHVITGASGAGKSALVAALDNLGYATFQEAALAILREQMSCNDKILPTGDRTAFMEMVLARSIRDYQEAQALNAPVFFDRAIPEWTRFLRAGEGYRHVATERYRYSNTVFVAAPWSEIYVCDHERTHSFERAEKSYEPTVAAYVEAGYEVCLIPKVSIPERAAFILGQVGNHA